MFVHLYGTFLRYHNIISVPILKKKKLWRIFGNLPYFAVVKKNSQSDGALVIFILQPFFKDLVVFPTWHILGPSSPQLHARISTKSQQKPPQAPPDTPGPRGRQRAPGQLLELKFPWFRGRYWISFFKLLTRC